MYAACMHLKAASLPRPQHVTALAFRAALHGLSSIPRAQAVPVVVVTGWGPRGMHVLRLLPLPRGLFHTRRRLRPACSFWREQVLDSCFQRGSRCPGPFAHVA